MKKVLFIDRDGTIVLEPEGYQLDSLDKLEFYPKAFQYLAKIANELDYELAMVTNQMVWERIVFRKIRFGQCRILF